MSNFIVFNGGIFNSTISCVVYTDKSVEEIYETMNELFNCYKLALKKSTGNSQLTKSNINMSVLNTTIDEDTFDNLMENILHNYFKVDEVINDRITDFATNKTNEKMGYKKVDDIDCWFVAMSVGPLKKIVLDVASVSNEHYKFEVFPKKTVKQTKPAAPKTKKFQIEDDDDDNEKPKIKPITIKEIKKEETEKKQKIKKMKKESESDDDNGIVKPNTKKSKDSKASRSKSKDEKPKSKKIEVKTTTSEDSDDEIREEIIKPKATKKSKEEKETNKERKPRKELNFDDSEEAYDLDDLEALSLSDISSTSEIEEMDDESDD